MMTITPTSETENVLAFEVRIKGETETIHQVAAAKEDIKRLARSLENAETLIKKSMEFLLERESNTEILPAFDLMTIARYFPGYEEEAKQWFL